MIYINPIEILELSDKNVSEIDSNLIKKAKRKLFADIDLSDNGTLNYKGLSLTKNDCEKVIDDLENSITLDFYFHLASNKLLNDFLVNGDDEIFSSFKQESIYKHSDFLKFISPYFAPKFDKTILKVFNDCDDEKLRNILRTQILISNDEINDAFKGLSIEIQNRLQQIDSITKGLENQESNYTEEDINDVIELIEKLIPVELFNQLPTYFQSQINKIALSAFNLSITAFNEFNNTNVAVSLIKHILELNIESVYKPRFIKDFEIFQKKHKERIEQEKNAPVLQKWATILLTIQSLIKSVDGKSIRASEALVKVNDLVNLNELNDLPSFGNEIRTQIAYSIRSLSVSCWNKHNDIKSSLSLIIFALQINVDDEVKIKFKQDKTELEELEKNHKGLLICHFCDINTPDDGCEIDTTIYKETGRSWFPRKSVQFTYSEIKIPRCRSCQEIHTNGVQNYFAVFFGFLILGVIIGLLTEGNHFIIGGIISGAIGWVIGKVLESMQVTKKGIKEATESTFSNHPILVNRIKEGWTFNKPSA
jgi:hypothetical protein